jgi:hypothetical protein
MEAVSLLLGILLMLVAAVGIVFYVALVIAIPVCRLLDWLAGEEPNQAKDQSLRPAIPRKVPRPRKKPAWLGRWWRAFRQRHSDSEER